VPLVLKCVCIYRVSQHVVREDVLDELALLVYLCVSICCPQILETFIVQESHTDVCTAIGFFSEVALLLLA